MWKLGSKGVGGECSSMQEISDLIVKEQLLNTLSSDLRMWVTERKPKTGSQGAGGRLFVSQEDSPKGGKGTDLWRRQEALLCRTEMVQQLRTFWAPCQGL